MAVAYQMFPNFFITMANSLPALLGQIPNSEYDHESPLIRVHAALRAISFAYRNKSRTSQRNDWQNPANRCAYVFLYFVKNSHLVYDALIENRYCFHNLMTQRREIKVCSIGGGPGSDIAGVIAFLDRMNYRKSMECVVMDLYPIWESTWHQIRRQLPPSKLQHFNSRYEYFDMTKKPSYCHVANILSHADLVTFVKSFSNVYKVPSAKTTMTTIMESLHLGAIVLYIDNSSNRDANLLFIRIAHEAGLRVLHAFVHNDPLRLPATESVRNFSDIFDFKPLRTCCVTIYLLRKQPRHYH